jgi:putative transposase
MCRTLGVSNSGLHASRSRPKSSRALDDEILVEVITQVHRESRFTYGAPRVHAELRLGQGITCGHNRVARLMRCSGLQGVHRRKHRRTTIRSTDPIATPDLVMRRFEADRPNELWVADITYVPTWQGFLYVASVVDVFSRMVVGWSMRDDLTTQLVLDAVAMAEWRREGKIAGVVHHSDRGCQYTSWSFGRRCQEAGIVPSVGRVGTAYDNAMAESFFATLETELIDRQTFRNKHEARLAVFDFIEGFYNPKRRHSALGYLSPLEWERQWESLNAS